MARIVQLILLLGALAACGTSKLPLPYTPSAAIRGAGGPPAVASVSVIDERGESAPDANWIGTIRGGFGNPLKRLETDRPLTEVVSDAVRDALSRQGLMGGPASPYDLLVTIRQFESDQIARREAKVQLVFQWTPKAAGRHDFLTRGDADIVQGSLITFDKGVFGSTDELRAVAAQAMSEAIEKALSDPALGGRLAASS